MEQMYIKGEVVAPYDSFWHYEEGRAVNAVDAGEAVVAKWNKEKKCWEEAKC